VDRTELEPAAVEHHHAIARHRGRDVHGHRARTRGHRDLDALANERDVAVQRDVVCRRGRDRMRGMSAARREHEQPRLHHE